MSENHDRPEPLTVEIDGRAITADMATWREVQKQITARISADWRAWEREQLAAGRVWFALYSVYGRQRVEVCFSREEADAVMERDDQASYAVVNPDGSFDWEPFYRNHAGTEGEWEQVIREERAEIADMTA